jgi:segregation and condensation protein A
VFARGAAEAVTVHRSSVHHASLLDLMQAYARVKTRDEFRPFVMDRRDLMTMEQALDRLRAMVGEAADWADISAYFPDDWQAAPRRRRSATAATFAASLELAKEGRIEIRQGESFAPIQIRRKDRA